jgi:hypothetical protein
MYVKVEFFFRIYLNLDPLIVLFFLTLLTYVKYDMDLYFFDLLNLNIF